MNEKRTVTTFSPKRDKVMFSRKYDELQRVIEEELVPLQNEAMEIFLKQQPIMDRITEMRKELVTICVHPLEFLEPIKEGGFVCKFCNKKVTANERED